MLTGTASVRMGFTAMYPNPTLRLVSEASRAREMAAALKAGSKRPSFRSARSLQSSPMTGPLDSSVNPLFLSADGGGAALNPLSGGGQAARDAVLSLKTPPPPELWTVFQSQFVTATEQVGRPGAGCHSLIFAHACTNGSPFHRSRSLGRVPRGSGIESQSAAAKRRHAAGTRRWTRALAVALSCCLAANRVQDAVRSGGNHFTWQLSFGSCAQS